jgi:hypothetical protein
VSAAAAMHTCVTSAVLPHTATVPGPRGNLAKACCHCNADSAALSFTKASMSNPSSRRCLSSISCSAAADA